MIKKAIKKLALYPRFRVFLLLFLIVVLFIVVINLFSVPPEQAAPVKSSQIQIPKVKLVETSPVGSDGYDQDREKQKEAVVAKDVGSGKSFFTDVFTDDAKKAKSVDPKTFYQERKKIKQQARGNGLEDEDQSFSQAPVYTDAQVNQVASAMKRSLDGASTLPGWQRVPMQGTMGMSSSSPARADRRDGRGNVMIKAGTIHYAVLETGLSSDQPGTPVMATIVSGKYKGSRLLGSFNRQDERLVIQFNMMTGDTFPEALGINAYAIDAQTAANSLASDVDHHYMLRYGSLFAASFLQGFGQAYQQYQYCPPGVTTCQIYQPGNLPNNTATIEQAKYRGLGQIGSNMSSEVMQNFSAPATVTVDRGTGIGVLYMSDVRNGDVMIPDRLGGLPSQLSQGQQNASSDQIVSRVVEAVKNLQAGSNSGNATPAGGPSWAGEISRH